MIINNAGIFLDDKKLENVTSEKMIESFKTNTLGPLLVTKHMYKFLKNNLGGFIFNNTGYISSISNNTDGNYYSYKSTKASLNMSNLLLNQSYKKFKF
jgi:NAD(P)-dependent dehydrogenase (short-subunit alcohol dehydrogenase family)